MASLHKASCYVHGLRCACASSSTPFLNWPVPSCCSGPAVLPFSCQAAAAALQQAASLDASSRHGRSVHLYEHQTALSAIQPTSGSCTTQRHGESCAEFAARLLPTQAVQAALKGVPDKPEERAALQQMHYWPGRAPCSGWARRGQWGVRCAARMAEALRLQAHCQYRCWLQAKTH